jgi:hypothetical protein
MCQYRSCLELLALAQQNWKVTMHVMLRHRTADQRTSSFTLFFTTQHVF